MTEQNLSGEQPNVTFNATPASADKDNGQNVVEQVKEQGSSYGKFKDAISLLSAYNNLQAEFTRKSQKLAELEKQSAPSKNLDASQKINDVSENGANLPLYKNADWRKMVNDFLGEHPEARDEAKAMSKILLENGDIARSKDCLMLAYKLSLANKYVKPALLANDDEFLNTYIVNNSRAKELIIDEYIKSLKNRPTAPAIISGQAKSISPTPAKKITSLDEAKTTIEKMFK